MRYLLFFVIVLFLLPACKLENSPQRQQAPQTVDASKEIRNWTIISGQKVGLIEANFGEADIIKAYGKENVVREEIGVGEGESTTATVLFSKTDNEIFVSWKTGKEFQEISEILIENTESPWTTSQGVSIGTSLEELAKINGKEFKFAGFEWDYSGFTNDWQGGKIDKNLTVFLEPDNPEVIYPDLLGDSLFSSDNPKAKEAKLKVRSMIINF